MGQSSFHELILSMLPAPPCVVEGTVTSASPLKVTLKNDAKMVLDSNLLIVPVEFTKHSVVVDLELVTGSILAGETSETTGDGAHKHNLSTMSVTKGKLTIDNALAVNDTVYLLQYNGGKQYYVLGKGA